MGGGRGHLGWVPPRFPAAESPPTPFPSGQLGRHCRGGRLPQRLSQHNYSLLGSVHSDLVSAPTLDLSQGKQEHHSHHLWHVAPRSQGSSEASSFDLGFLDNTSLKPREEAK